MADWAALDTPVPLVDVDRLECNLAAMAELARRHGVLQRPHTKTHKTAEVAERQVAHGASGLAVAKVGEAEAMVAAGFDDLLIAYPVIGEQKYRRVLALLDRARIRFAIDSAAGAEAAGAFFAAHATQIDVLIEHDGGAGRSGVQSVEEALALADRIADETALRLVGVMSYANAYGTADPAEQAAIGTREGAEALAVARAIGAEEVVSVGSTPTARHVVAVDGVTELRAGVYAFNDLKQCSLGVATLDQCALTVLASVVSHPRPERYVLDAGIKALAGEDYGWGTYGRVLERPDLVLTRATEEHGIVTLPDDAEDPRWAIGTRVRIVPDHACGCVNMHDALTAVQGEQVVEHWPVIGRGRVR